MAIPLPPCCDSSSVDYLITIFLHVFLFVVVSTGIPLDRFVRQYETLKYDTKQLDSRIRRAVNDLDGVEFKFRSHARYVFFSWFLCCVAGCFTYAIIVDEQDRN